MPYERIRAVIDLDALIYNIQSMKQNLRPGTQVMAVVKADGYGHGAVPVAEAAEPYVDGFGTATAEEALQLRRQGIRKSVLVLGPVFESAWEAMLKEQIRFTLFEEDQAAALSAMARKLGAEALVHLAVDTGMNRIGMACTEAAADMAARISRMPGIRTEGLFTHLARADETDKEPTRRQLEAYRRFASWLEQRGVAVSVRHVSNSAGIIDQEGTGWDMVRAGISLYGLYPSHEVQRNRIPLRPVMELKSHISYVKEIPAGAQVSYGGTFTADHPMTVATIPVGYGDGYPRYLSGKGWVLIGGKKAPILGRVCMDQMMADVSSVPQARRGEEVTLLGRDGDACIGAEELAGAGGGFHYELLCGISKRVPRVYVKDGKTVTISDISGC